MRVTVELNAQREALTAKEKQHRDSITSQRTSYWVHAVREKLAERRKVKEESKKAENASKKLSDAQKAFETMTLSMVNDRENLIQQNTENAVRKISAPKYATESISKS